MVALLVSSKQVVKLVHTVDRLCKLKPEVLHLFERLFLVLHSVKNTAHFNKNPCGF